ncbi:uncharacterized protein BDW70DRAFT_66143 [Aspergillus foveolatus]|uniref:uncharacterized protein n=1 Tax=Aspergillus foveolatus TaxID=210207 RepID=UPI003CCDFD08
MYPGAYQKLPALQDKKKAAEAMWPSFLCSLLMLVNTTIANRTQFSALPVIFRGSASRALRSRQHSIGFVRSEDGIDLSKDVICWTQETSLWAHLELGDENGS